MDYLRYFVKISLKLIVYYTESNTLNFFLTYFLKLIYNFLVYDTYLCLIIFTLYLYLPTQFGDWRFYNK